MTIERVAVLGGGSMGAGIAESSARAGLATTVRDIDDDALAAGRKRVEASLDRAEAAGKLGDGERAAVLERIRFTVELADLADADLVIEAVPESVELKAAALEAVVAHVSPEALIASNTSSISIARLAADIPNPERVLGLHFFNPVPVMGLVEVVSAVMTSEETIAAASEFVRKIDKQPIETRDRPGFVVNILLVPYLMSAIRLYEEGFASAEAIDEGMRVGCGHPMGPLALSDLIGLDVLCDVAKSLYDGHKNPGYAPPPLLRQMVAARLNGRKSGRGFYTYKA